MKNIFSKIFTKILFTIIIFNSACKEENKKVTITILGEDSATLKAMKELKTDYESKNNIILDFKSHSFEDALNKANEDFKNKTGLYDIVLQYNFALSSFVRNSYVYPLDEISKDIPIEEKKFEDDIFPNTWKEVGFYYKNFLKPEEGFVKVGYPFAANTMILVYNKELFNKNEYKNEYKKTYNEDLIPPKDWLHFERIAKFFTKPDKKTFGVCLEGSNAGYLYFEWSNYLYSMNASVMEKKWGWESNKNTKITLNSKNTIKATKFFKNLKNYNSSEFFTTDSYSKNKVLKKGNTAMALVWTDYLSDLVYDQKGNIDNRFGFSEIPGEKSMLAGGAFFINRNSNNPKEAFKYINYLMQKTNQINLMKKGLSSPLKSVYEDKEIKKIPYSEALKKSLYRATSMLEAGPDSQIISDIITKNLQQMWNNEITEEEAIAKSQQEIIEKRKDLFDKL